MTSVFSVTHAQAIRIRLLHEELHLRRRSDDLRRYVEVFRRGAIDANPHQLEAALFALQRLDSGGALLCDEVGLGKTIEAGIVLSQLRMEGRDHQLIVVPLTLAAQWQAELEQLFSLSATVLDHERLGEARQRGLYIIGRELATTRPHAEKLRRLGPWDLIVVDEAHELFSSLYMRFSRKTGAMRADLRKGRARRAAVLRQLVGPAPVLLLTATPLQNNLYELWSLVHYIDRRNHTLGGFHEFCGLFVKPSGKAVADGRTSQLKQRLQAVVQRSLREQAQRFLEKPFTERRCLTVNFHMPPQVRELYDAVDHWLTRTAGVYAARYRHLVRLALRRRMASSPHALAASLHDLRLRIEARLEPQSLDPDEPEFEPQSSPKSRAGQQTPALAAELETVRRLESLAQAALEAPFEKLDKLVELVQRVVAGREEGVAPKLVVFTESRRTLDALSTRFEGEGLEVSRLSGGLQDASLGDALLRWHEEVGRFLAEEDRPTGIGRARAAIVHEFRTRSQVLVSTEAGARGLNLQFCNCLVNFDLPWNPQRVEQRIGRVHRYGQSRDVLIVNFVNLDNQTEQRVYDILKQKLHLFEGLFGISDGVLGQLEDALGLENRVAQILDSFPAPEDRERAFDELDLEIGERARAFQDERLKRARSLLTRLDATVQARFRELADALPTASSQRDESLLELLRSAGLAVRVVGSEDLRTLLEIDGKRYHFGPPKPGPEWGEPLHLQHPWIRALSAEALERTEGRELVFSGPRRCCWDVYRVRLQGVEEEERLLVLGDDPGLLGPQLAEAVFLRESVLRSPEHEGLAAELERLRCEVERAQRGLLDRRLRNLRWRRETAEGHRQSQRRAVEAELIAAKRRLWSSSSVDACREAERACKRLKARLDRLAAEEDRGRSGLEAELADEQDRLHRMAFVRTEKRRLFRARIEENSP